MNTRNFYTLLATPSCANESTLQELKSLVLSYPWFSLGYQLLLETSFRNGDEGFNDYSGKAAAYTTNRSHFYGRLQQPTVEYEEEAFELLEEEPPVKKEKIPARVVDKQIVVVGGEYFGSSDFEEATITSDDPLSRFIVTQPKINPTTSPLNTIDLIDTKEERVAPLDYVTETLAQIYVNQELYDLAISTYKKLILQIPEKSTYFAAQIKEIKKLK